MPAYPYRCTDCAQKFDEERPRRDSNASATCPRCHGNAVRRFIVQFPKPRRSAADAVATEPPQPVIPELPGAPSTSLGYVQAGQDIRFIDCEAGPGVGAGVIAGPGARGVSVERSDFSQADVGVYNDGGEVDISDTKLP